MQDYAEPGSYQFSTTNAHSHPLQQYQYTDTSGSSFPLLEPPTAATAIYNFQRCDQIFDMPRTKGEASQLPESPLRPLSPLPEFPATIDLICSLCPKTPKFSDISHLLTHIASKSHLSNKFKLEVESRREKHAKAKLDEFDYWYNTNSLDDLLSDRLVAKEDKKKRKARASDIKTEIKEEFKVLKSSKKVEEDPEFRAPFAKMRQTKSRTVAATPAPSSAGDNEQSIYSTPKTRSKVPNFSEEVSLHNPVDPMLTSAWKSDHEEDEDEDEAEEPKDLSKEVPEDDASRLKGIQWPGMTVFDAASAEGKRMRNQRKDSKVLRNMMATSKGVEPAEISYHANGEFRGSRDIFGPLSTESSPVQIKRVPKKRTPQKRTPQKRRPRKPTFKAVNTNVPRPRPSRAKKPVISNAVESEKPVNENKRPQHLSSVNPPNFNPLRFSGFNSSRHMSVLDEDDEYRLTAGKFAKKQKTFTVFEDNMSPSRTESPLEEPRFEFPPSHSLQPAWNNSMTSGQAPSSPTPAAKPVLRSLTGLNGFNQSNVHQSLPDVSTHPFHARRTMSDSGVFAAPMAFHHDFNPLFNHGTHGNSGFHRSYSAYTPQYLFGGPHGNSAYLESHLHGPMSSMGYQQFMGDFRQVNPMATANMNQVQNQSMSSMSSISSMPPMTAVADMGTSNENDTSFNMRS